MKLNNSYISINQYLRSTICGSCLKAATIKISDAEQLMLLRKTIFLSDKRAEICHIFDGKPENNNWE